MAEFLRSPIGMLEKNIEHVRAKRYLVQKVGPRWGREVTRNPTLSLPCDRLQTSATQGASASQLSPQGRRNLPTRADRGLGSSALLLPVLHVSPYAQDALARCVFPGPSFSFLALASAWLFFACVSTYNAIQFS